MTAPSGGKISPPPVIKSKVGSFAIDPNFALHQTVKVAIRIRHSHSDEQDIAKSNNKKSKNADKKAWNLSKTGAMDTLTQKGTARKIEGRTVFHFDQVFDEETQTPLVYKSVARSMVKSVLDGKHATLFAYGQTGSGKTFTMQGDGRSQSGQAGIIQLVVADLFRFMKQGEASKRDFTVKVCYVEVYSETIRDLLADDIGSTASMGTPSNSIQGELEENEKVKLRTTPNGDVVMDCTHVEVSSVDEVLELLVDGNTQRVVSKLDMNTHSPRSHSILRIMVESRAKQQSVNGLGDESGVVFTRVSDFNLVDLAGSEDVKDINNGNIRLKQGSSVNKSLLTLTSIIHSLGLPEKKRPKHIPYEESKLTEILQPHLKGNSDMGILCCVSPSKAFVDETKSTLKFAMMAKNVQVTPKVNEIQDDAALIRKLRSELAAAKHHVQEMEVEQKHSDSPYYDDQRYNNNNNNNGGGGGDVDYGYEDMDTPKDNEQYGYEDMDAPPPASPERQYMDGETNNRNYVMPKNQPLHEEEGEGGYANNSTEDSEEGSVEDPFFRSVEYDTYNDEEEAEDMEDDGEEYDEDYERMNASAQFKLDQVDPERADQQVHRFLNGRTTSYDTDDRYQDGDYDDDYADDDADEVDQDDEYGSSPLDRISSTNPKSQYYRQQQQHEHDQQPRQEFPMPGRYNADEDESDEEEDSGYDSPKNKTAKTEDESYDDGPEASYADISLKVGSVVSAPDTLKGETSMMLAADRSAGYGTVESAQDRALDGRGNHDVSWDTMDLNTTRPEHVGEPIRAMQSIYKRDVPIPDEITIMHITPLDGDNNEVCLLDRLNDAEARSAFLQGKLDMTDDLVEGVFKDLERARLCIHDLVYRNVQLAAKLKEKRREDTKEEYQDGEKAVEQYWLLKGSMYVGLFFFFFGGYEYFMAAVLLVWLILEANLST